MIWHDPGFPSLLVTYGVSNDLFFSGHTAIAVFAATELYRLNKKLLLFGIVLSVFEATSVLILRAHYTMDVLAGAGTALLIAALVPPYSEKLDHWLHHVVTGR
jgi:membrane-associated phospholipid phosphatase